MSKLNPTGSSQSVERSAKVEDMAEAYRESQSKVTVTAAGKGMLTSGFTKLSLPEDKSPKPLQLKSTRDSVGSAWPGPKGRVGKTLSGKASPSSAESFIKVAHNKEFQAR